MRRTSRTIKSFITQTKKHRTTRNTCVVMRAPEQELQTNALLELHGGLQQV